MERIFNELKDKCALNSRINLGSLEVIVEIIDEISKKYKDKYVSIGVYKQVAWERDMAIEQLHELGYEFGEKIDSNDGWIPCSSGELPDTDREVLASVRMKDDEDRECYLAVTSYGDIKIGCFSLGKGWRPAWEYWGYWEVVAWKDETPYQPKGE